MPPKKKKEGESKKAVQKKKEKLVEDKTFGLKNKNKSKKVQAQIQSIERNVMNGGNPRQRKLEEERKKAKAEAKARKKAMQDEQEALFGEALMAVKKKTTTKTKGSVEAKGRDHDDDDKKPQQSRAMKMMYQMDAKEAAEKLKEDPFYIRSIEDEIEEQRQKKVEELKKSGKGTPVTPETFAAWQERKRKRKAEEARKKVEAELKKKKGGKGLSVLSGRDLFEYKKELFVDDEEALANVQEELNHLGDADDHDDDLKMPPKPSQDVQNLAAKVQDELFLEGEDDDLDDIDDDDE